MFYCGPFEADVSFLHPLRRLKPPVTMQQGGSSAHISITASIIHSIRIANNIHNASITYPAVYVRKRPLYDGGPVTLHRNRVCQNTRNGGAL